MNKELIIGKFIQPHGSVSGVKKPQRRIMRKVEGRLLTYESPALTYTATRARWFITQHVIVTVRALCYIITHVIRVQTNI